MRWTPAPDALFYETCLDTTNNGVCDTGWQTAAQATQRTLSGFANGRYYWQVRAQTATGSTEANGGTWWEVRIDVPVPAREYIYLGDKLLAELSYSLTAPPVLTYYHTDLLGSVRAVTDTAGATVLPRHDYFPFGESTSPLTGDPRRFTGKERDADTAFDYFGARYYRNVWGRFTSVDPVAPIEGALRDPQVWNRYAYVRNNPLRYTDPDGKCIWDLCIGEAVISAEAIAAAGAAAVTASAIIWHNREAIADSVIGAGKAVATTVERLGDAIAKSSSKAEDDKNPYVRDLRDGVDSSGKAHVQAAIPKKWTLEDLRSAADTLRESIATRRAELTRRGNKGGHGDQLAKEEQLLRQIERQIQDMSKGEGGPG